MADSSTIRRIWHHHPAHRTIGVSGVASPLRSWRPADNSWDGATARHPMRVAIVSCGIDGAGRAAPALFERVLRGRGRVRCRRVDFAAAAQISFAKDDCVVVFGRSVLRITADWSEVDAETLAENQGGFASPDTDFSPGFSSGLQPDSTLSGLGEEFRAEVAAAPFARRHPLLDGVGPFVARFRRDQMARTSNLDESCILVGKTAVAALPVAWVRCDGGRVFDTLLGSAEDFCRPEFVRLALNALDWVGRRFSDS